VSIHTFYNPDLVEQLAACGITARRSQSPVAPTRGFVLAGAARPRGRATTHVVASHPNVTITGSQFRLLADEARALATASVATARTLTATSVTAAEPRNALELVEDCARLRRDNQRLSDEVIRLRAEIARLTGPATAQQRETSDLDDSAQRFALLELE
jgi:uncharacterized protein YlxW (UPF0749 family)